MLQKILIIFLCGVMVLCAGCTSSKKTHHGHSGERSESRTESQVENNETSLTQEGSIEYENEIENNRNVGENESAGAVTDNSSDLTTSDSEVIGSVDETSSSETASMGASDTVDRTEYSASEDGAHAITADGSSSDGSSEGVSYSDILVTKTGSASGEDADFYGDNAAIFATNGAQLTLDNAYITTDGGHANGVFSYGDGTVITISNSTILTESNNSGGLMITGGGTIYADRLYIVTQGGSSAAIRSDRGGGTGIVNGGYYETNGKGSPAIYSTADITVNGATLVANVSEGVVVEGKNSVTLIDTDITANHTQKNSSKSDAYQAVKIYQSMSGDAAEGMAYFTMEGGSMTSLNGGMFWVSNTSATISIKNVSFTYADDDFLTVEAAGWGKEGSNGGHVTFLASEQVMEGRITVDSISSLDLQLLSGTVYTGSINETGDSGEVTVTVSEGAVWSLTADSYVSSLDVAGTIELNGYSLYINGELYST